MLKLPTVLGLFAAATLAATATTSASAQARSAINATALDSAVIAAPGNNQATMQRFLRDSRVIAAAEGMGVSAADLSAKVATMDEAQLQQVAEQTRAADLGLAGGDQTVVLSTTALLLIIIIVILLAS